MAPTLAVEPSARDWIPVPKELTPCSGPMDIPPSGYLPHNAISCGKNGCFVIPTTTEGCLNNRVPTDSKDSTHYRSQLEQQNFEMMNSLQQKNQQQIKDLSAQLQTGLQAFLQQSMEQMFNRLAPAQTQPPAATSTTPPPHIVSITPMSAILPAKP